MASDPLFKYTSGRWLWNEEEQLKARYRWFNVLNLQEAACEAVGASQCLSLEKIGEGNSNKAYRLTLDNGRKVIAKIPHPNAGPRQLTTASEVATMEYARTILALPVPKVFAWSATDQNPIEAEYIIMEEAQGSQLDEVWQDLNIRSKHDIISDIVDIESKLLSISFDKIGSLYFQNSGISRCSPIVAKGGSQDVTDKIQSQFCIGPTVRQEFWEKERSSMQEYQGPWNSTVDYLKSIANREIEWIQKYAKPVKGHPNPWLYTSAEYERPEAHIAALRKYLSAIPLIVPQDPELVSPRMWHPDFHAGNIYVQDGRVTSIIDWQGTWTTPAFIGANPPMMLDYTLEMLMELPENFKTLDEATQEQLRYQVSQSILIKSYETWTREKNPVMHKVMRLPHGQTLKQLEAFANASWDNCLYPLQECLICVEREWEFFDAKEPCPYHYSADELERHSEEAEPFSKSQEFWRGLEETLSDDGYTTNENFGKAVETLRTLRTDDLARLKGEERTKFDESTWWVLELKVPQSSSPAAPPPSS